MTPTTQLLNNMPESSGDDFTHWDLEGHHSGALLDFMRLMRGHSGFSLVFLQYNDLRYRDKLIPHLNRHATTPATFCIGPEIDFSGFEQRLFALSVGHDLIHVIGLNEWLLESREEKFRGFNYHRELIAENVQTTLALWMTEDDIRDFALKAPDMWAWRKGVIDFSAVRRERDGLQQSFINLGSADLIERRERVAEIQAWLAEHTEKSISRANLLRELGQIQHQIGEVDEGLRAFSTASEIFRLNNYKRDYAFTIGEMARSLVNKGDVDKALMLHKERLRVVETLKDVVSIANTLWSMAQIYLTKKDFKKALTLLKRSYGIVLKLRQLEGICFVGRDLGQLLCATGEKQRGVEILRRSEDGWRKLGREDLADQIKKFLGDLRSAKEEQKRQGNN